MIDPIQQAIEYANRTEHEGAGYTLLIAAIGMEPIEVDVYCKEGLPYLLRVRHDDHDDDRREIFFTPSNVSAVEVLW